MAERKRPREPSAERPSQNPYSPGSLLNLTSPPPPSDTDGDVEVEENLIEDDISDVSEEDGENLYPSDFERDYEERPELDRYDSDHIDDETHEDLDITARRNLERMMDERDVRDGRTAADYLLDTNNYLQDKIKRRRRKVPEIIQLQGTAPQLGEFDEESDDDDYEGMNNEELADVKASSIGEWIKNPAVQKGIVRQFSNFLRKYTKDGKSVYWPLIEELTKDQLQSLEVSYKHLESDKPILARFLKRSPVEMLQLFDEVATDVIFKKHPHYEELNKEMHVRIIDYPILNTLRDLRHTHLNTFVRVSGVVTRRTGVFPQLKFVKYNCLKCGGILGPYTQDLQSEIKLNHCSHCQSKGPFSLNTEQTMYSDYQKITMQETPGTIPAGRLPRHREVILLCDLIDTVKPGDEIEVTGVYRNNFDFSLNIKNGFPVFATIIEANYIVKREDLYSTYRLTDEDREQLKNLAKDPKIANKIYQSIAPSIYGHEDIKRAIALSLFGGVAKNIQDKHRLRGDINILMLGDPGTAKSQFLKYVEKTAHRAVYTSGRGSSSVGLTASVKKDTITREWTLEGGAFVLADNGICLIDEFDKMEDKDRVSIHEAMEQQTISISKAGINSTLNARCAVIAAANPVGGRYNTSKSFSDNVELTEPILSRFDVLCVVKDTVDPTIDEFLAEFVVESHVKSHPDHTIVPSVQQDKSTIPQDLLRKYIIYAKQIKPQLSNINENLVSDLYSKLRREAQNGGIPITVRYLESMLRLAEAHARIHLRSHTAKIDIEVAIDVVLQSFFDSQKFAISNRLRRQFAQYINKSKEQSELLTDILNDMIKEKARLKTASSGQSWIGSLTIKVSEFMEQARKFNIHHEVDNFLRSDEFSVLYDWDQSKDLIIKSFT
ncbi:8021_t:CDS:10 [Funneliformis caledonium]|uniref:DNA replication licensing factor MCM2 n=2 Tax=Funneliformis TaxID=1117308 RepID=A0A9N8Z8H1_9GLOM|nr:8021_t:CDS:10 [Funneliformis caledonium]CAG8533746.1 13434_t:CDS:10 [Funneliformis mosseae]